MSSTKIWKFRSIFPVHGGCVCDPTATDIVEPKPRFIKSRTVFSDQKSSGHGRWPSSSDSSWMGHGGRNSAVDDDEEHSFTTYSMNIETSSGGQLIDDHDTAIGRSCPKIKHSLAVVKESDDPYRDFRHSMLQMILEYRIYSREDLQQLLDCYLQLNSQRHRGVIIRAFVEIWNGGNSPAPAEADGHVGRWKSHVQALN